MGATPSIPLKACPRCNGAGEQRSMDPREVEQGIADTCYHCGGSTKVEDTPEQRREERLSELVARLADYDARRWRRAIEEGPDGFECYAAENRLTPHEAFKDRVWSTGDKVGQALGGLPTDVLDLMLDAIDSLDRRARGPASH